MAKVPFLHLNLLRGFFASPREMHYQVVRRRAGLYLSMLNKKFEPVATDCRRPLILSGLLISERCIIRIQLG